MSGEGMRWSTGGVDWDEYVNDLAGVTRSRGWELMDKVDVNRMAASITGWIQEVNGRHIKVPGCKEDCMVVEGACHLQG